LIDIIDLTVGAIAEQIIDQGGDDGLGLKGNQYAFHGAVEYFFIVAQANHLAGVAHDDIEEIDNNHGQLEIRRYWMAEALRNPHNTES
jgi:hypothetical protein